jgi:CHASE1-domain containing sensor protein
VLHTTASRYAIPQTTGPDTGDLRDHPHQEAMRRRRLRLWIALAIAVVLVGSTSALLAARTAAAAHAKASRNQFSSSSAQITSTLELAIEKEQDLALDASGFIVGAPNASNAAFDLWANSVKALDRHPEVLGLGQVVIVPADQLAAFATRAAADPAGPMPADGAFHVVPSGARARYCLLANAQSRSAAGAFPAGY